MTERHLRPATRYALRQWIRGGHGGFTVGRGDIARRTMARQSMHQAERGLALLRILFGLWLLREALRHLVWLPWPWAAPGRVQWVTTQLAAQSLDHPSFWVRSVVQQTLLPSAELFVSLQTVLGLVAGVSLTCGLLTVPGSLLTLALALVGGVLSHYQSDVQLGYYLMQGAAATVFAITRAGRRWGGDALLSRSRDDSWMW